MATYKTNLSDKELLQSQEMSHELWAGGKTLEERFEVLKKRINYANGSFLSMAGIVDDKGIVLTSMKQYYSKLNYRDQTLNAIGLGAIFTNEKHRKNGWAKKLISMVLEEALEEGYDCAYLFSDIGEEYYRPFGFVPIPSIDFRTSKEDLPQETSLEEKVWSESDTDTVLSLGQKRFGDSLRVGRDKPYWNFFKEINTTLPPLLFTSKGKEVGYACLSSQGETLWLDECVIEPSLENEALGFFRKYMQNKGMNVLEGWHHSQMFAHMKRELLPRKKANPMILFFKGTPNGWSPEKSWISSLDHF